MMLPLIIFQHDESLRQNTKKSLKSIGVFRYNICFFRRHHLFDEFRVQQDQRRSVQKVSNDYIIAKVLVPMVIEGILLLFESIVPLEIVSCIGRFERHLKNPVPLLLQ